MITAINQQKTVKQTLHILSYLIVITGIGCSNGDDTDKVLPSVSDPTEGTVITLAGTGEAGLVNDSGTSASFNRPVDLAIDSNGDLFVVDQGNDRIRKVTQEGMVSSLAGSSKGFNDGTGSDAKFNAPISIALDKNNNLLLVDVGNYRIRKITPSGMVSTFMGSTPGIFNDHHTEARMGISTSIAISSNGVIYFSDYGEKGDSLSIIRRIYKGGVINWLGGAFGYKDGAGEDAQFWAPSSIVVDEDGNLYIADTKNHLIRKATSAGAVTTYAGSTKGYADGSSTEAKFNEPEGLAIDSEGNLYVADAVNHKIRKIDPDRNISTLAGSTRGFMDGKLLEAKFSLPTAVVIDKEGHLYVTDLGNNCIRKIILQ